MSRISAVLRFCSMSVLLCAGLCAQETTGTITGTVRDATGGIIPDAAVVLRNAGTGVERRVNTGATGEYVATGLPVGNYEVTVEKQGFRKGTVSAIQLSVDSRVRVDFTLEIGSVVEVTSVSATVSQLETESATMSG